MRFRSSLVAVASLFALAAVPASPQAVDFPNCNDCSALQLNGSATCTGGVLRLTDAVGGSTGSAFLTTPVQLGSGAAFNTAFQVDIGSGDCGDGDGPGADGTDPEGTGRPLG